MFYDEKGKHVRTKKEILDESGNIRPGCYIVPKGEIYEKTFFDSKEEIFKHSSFLKDVKQMYTDLMNQLVKDEAEKLSVFEPDGPYLATKKIGKNNPKAEEIQADNEARKEWNRTVDEALVVGVPSDEIAEVKQKNISLPVKKSIQKEGQKPGLLRAILQKAVAVLLEKIRMAAAPEKPELKVDMEIFKQMQKVRRKLLGIRKSIREIDDQIQKKQKRLVELTGLSGTFRLKEKKELMNSITDLISERTKQSSLLKETVTEAGYRSVDSFMRAFNKSQMLVEEYLKTQGGIENGNKSSQQTQQKKTNYDRGILNWEIEKAVDYYELPIIIAYPGYSKIGAPSELNSMWTKSLAERIKNERAHCIHIPFKKEPIFDAINQFSVVNSKYPKGGALGCYSEEAYKSWGIV